MRRLSFEALAGKRVEQLGLERHMDLAGCHQQSLRGSIRHGDPPGLGACAGVFDDGFEYVVFERRVPANKENEQAADDGQQGLVHTPVVSWKRVGHGDCALLRVPAFAFTLQCVSCSPS